MGLCVCNAFVGPFIGLCNDNSHMILTELCNVIITGYGGGGIMALSGGGLSFHSSFLYYCFWLHLLLRLTPIYTTHILWRPKRYISYPSFLLSETVMTDDALDKIPIPVRDPTNDVRLWRGCGSLTRHNAPG